MNVDELWVNNWRNFDKNGCLSEGKIEEKVGTED
jgi:hypothetical protein